MSHKFQSSIQHRADVSYVKLGGVIDEDNELAELADKIPTGRWRFEHILQDIQTLNERATRGELHISAISIHAYAHVLDKYALLPCGASMGDGYGPMLVSTYDTTLAVPGGAPLHGVVVEPIGICWRRGPVSCSRGRVSRSHLHVAIERAIARRPKRFVAIALKCGTCCRGTI